MSRTAIFRFAARSLAPVAQRARALLLLLAFAFAASGCGVMLVSEYDARAFEEILAVGRNVDRFYGNLLEAPEDERPYRLFAAQYVEIESDLRGMVMRNRARVLNTESTRIAEIILKQFQDAKQRHRDRNRYTGAVARRDRDRFGRLFASAARAEQVKNGDDADPRDD